MVVIVERDAGAVRLDDVAFDVVFPENYGMNEARALGHILKVNIPRPAGKFRARGRAHAAAPNALAERSGSRAEGEARGAERFKEAAACQPSPPAPSDVRPRLSDLPPLRSRLMVTRACVCQAPPPRGSPEYATGS